MADQGGERRQISEPGTTEELCGGGEVSVVPLLPVAERGQAGKGRQKIGRNRKRNDHRQRSRIGAPRVLDVLSHARYLFVSGVEPNGQSKTHSEHFRKRLVRWNQRYKSIGMPLVQAKKYQGNPRNQPEQS